MFNTFYAASTTAESSGLLANLVEAGKTVLNMATETGQSLLGLEVVQIFLAVSLVGLCIGVIANGIQSLRG